MTGGYTSRLVRPAALSFLLAGLSLGQVQTRVYVDATAGPVGNTVRACDGAPLAWVGGSGVYTDGLWSLRPFGNQGSCFEASGDSGIEDAPLLRTRLGGLIPGAEYEISVHYWSLVGADWSLRAGLDPGELVLYDAGGSAGCGLTGLNLDPGGAANIHDRFGGPAFASYGGTQALPDSWDLWNAVTNVDLPANTILWADGSPAVGVSVNVGRQHGEGATQVYWGYSDLVSRTGSSFEGFQAASPVLQTYERENTSATTIRFPAIAIENLPPGRYDVYVVADNTYHTVAAGDNRAYRIYAGVDETSSGYTTFAGFATQIIANTYWDAWRPGANYARFSLIVANPGEDIVLVSEETAGLDNHSLFSAIQIVRVLDGTCCEFKRVIGRATAGSQGVIDVYVDDKPATGPDDRSWYDGISYERIIPEPPPPVIRFNDNGGWCWFQDERAILHDGKLLIGSAANVAGTDGAARSGNIELTTYDNLAGGPPVVSVLSPHLQNDDHDNPAVLVRPDGRYLAVYSKHGSDKLVRYRISAPGDSTTWGPEQTYTALAGVTYANLFRLAAEGGGTGLVYNFYRGEGFDPNILVSGDDGTSWSYLANLIANDGRPYVKCASNDVDTVHFAYTEGHPAEWAPGTGIYHAYMKGGVVYRSDGTPIRPVEALPMTPQEGTQVYAGSQAARAWISDIHLDALGRPYLAFSDRRSDADHRYHYARWDGSTWHEHEIAYAGRCLYAGQQDYTGLVALDPSNPDVLYISTDADPVTGAPLISGADGRRHWEIFKGVTGDGGTSWSWTPVTADSRYDNLRPIMPIGRGPYRALLWLRGTYTTYTNYDLDIVGLILIAPDFDGDGDVDVADFATFQACFNGPGRPAGRPGCAPADFDHDNDVDVNDFAVFQACFNGAGNPAACAGP